MTWTNKWLNGREEKKTLPNCRIPNHKWRRNDGDRKSPLNITVILVPGKKLTDVKMSRERYGEKQGIYTVVLTKCKVKNSPFSVEKPGRHELKQVCLLRRWKEYIVLSRSVVSDSLQPHGSSVHGIFQSRIMEWVAISSSRESSRPRGGTCVSCIARQFLYHGATWEVHKYMFTYFPQ